MQLIPNILKLNHYLDIDIKDKSFDDTEKAEVIIDAVFSAEVTPVGFQIEVYEIKNVKWSYKGIIFKDDEDEEHEITGSSDESWNIEIHKSKTDKEFYGIRITNAYIDLENKKIILDFEC